MAMTTENTPMSRVQFGLARRDITPPIGIYHPLWGAARHHQATGIHRSLTAEIMAFGDVADQNAKPFIRVQMDACGFVDPEYFEALVHAVCEGADVLPTQVMLAVSHTHAACFPVKNRIGLPGGDLIAPYIREIADQLCGGAQEAVEGMQEVVIAYATGRCNMAGNRDYWDEEYNGFTCGYNPGVQADDTVVVARVTDRKGKCICNVVNYACHPTTLAWENTLISPDFVGAMREVVERETDGLCVFAQGACGDLGPRDGFVGHTQVADRNGRQLGYAALSALASLGAPETDFRYQGAVVSGATLGTWAHVEATGVRMTTVSQFGGGTFTVDLPYIDLPTVEELNTRIDAWREKQQEADEKGDTIAARDAGAQAERAFRWAGKLVDLSKGDTYPMAFSVLRMGDAVWVTTGGEPYNFIQQALRARFPEVAIVFSPLVGAMNVGYLLLEDCYGKGLYQEQPSVLAQGCLEALIEAVAKKIADVIS
jgi:hypothetical protein